MADSIQVEDFTVLDVPKNSDLARRIRASLRDGNIDTDSHALYKHEVLGKQIVRAILEGEIRDRGLLEVDEARR